MKHALNYGKMKKLDQLPREKSLGIFSKREKSSLYSYGNDRIGNDVTTIFCSSLIPLVKSYLKILIFPDYPNKILIILTKRVQISKLRVLRSMQCVFLLAV